MSHEALRSSVHPSAANSSKKAGSEAREDRPVSGSTSRNAVPFSVNDHVVTPSDTTLRGAEALVSPALIGDPPSNRAPSASSIEVSAIPMSPP
jgi:hypothetical protein